MKVPRYPVRDAGSLYESRVRELDTQLDGIDLSPNLSADIEALAQAGEAFRAGEVSVEDVCYGAMKTYWSNLHTLRKGDGAAYNLSRLGHDLGAYAGVKLEILEHLWEQAILESNSR